MARFPASVLVLPFAAVLWAQQPASRSSKPSDQARSAVPEAGAISAGVYRNATFGFSYKLPYGSGGRTTGMHDAHDQAARSRVLLAIFDRPPEVTAGSLNSPCQTQASS